MRKNPYRLRCYARPEKDYILGICVDLDIAVRGHSIREVKSEMTKAIEVYLKSLDAKNMSDVFPRRVPLSVMLDYYFVILRVHTFRVKTNFQIFCEQLIPKDFVVCPAAA